MANIDFNFRNVSKTTIISSSDITALQNACTELLKLIKNGGGESLLELY